MPPKAAAANKPALSQDEFLAACLQCAKEKIDIDFDKLATMTGMSKGGAANKYRAISKKLESIALGASTNLAVPPTAATANGAKAGPAKRKGAPKSTEVEVKVDPDAAAAAADDASENDKEPATKKPKKSVATTKKAQAKKGGKTAVDPEPVADEQDAEASVKEEDTEEDVEEEDASDNNE